MFQGTGLWGDKCASCNLGKRSIEQLGKDLLTPPESVSGILSVITRICRREERKHVDISGKDKSD